MRNICLIVVLFLAMVDASAQWNWKENSSFGWRKNESPWRSGHSWRSGSSGESATFHKGKDINDSYYTDRFAKTSYGFIGERNGQVQRDYYRRRQYSAETYQLNGISTENKAVARRNSGLLYESRPARHAVTHRHGSNLLSRKVWDENRHIRTTYSGGSANAIDYGRRVKPEGAPDNNNTSNAVGMENGSKIKEIPAVGSNEDSDSRTPDQESSSVAGEQYGFGEVPRDDIPVGDGIGILLLSVFLFATYKFHCQKAD